MNNTLITKDNKDKIRVIHISCEPVDGSFVISRSSGLLDGKKVEGPKIVISKGKVKRTLQEQAELQYNSLIKQYLDKGYKDVTDVELTDENIKKILPSTKQDQNGAKKPMLCKILDPSKLGNKTWECSYKIDGVRSLFFLRNGEVHTSSRGGQDYDIPATYIRQDPYINKILKENPNLILDGEIYRHGWPLSKISGLCRQETLCEEHKELRLYCYDIVDETLPFKDRLTILNKLREDCPPDSRLLVLHHTSAKGIDEMNKLHDKAVSEGYEGLVIRDPDKPYKCGARDTRMQKIKRFVDNEFIIKGLAEGLRDEDLCFVMETKEGYTFKAKPIGTREDKQWYREHINELIGQYGTVKYFGFTKTDKPVPNLPVFKYVRPKEDM